jgi:quercetin dioxygenase-like cupin family protein
LKLNKEIMRSRKGLVLGAGLGVVILAVAAHAAVMNILTVGTTRYSEIINGPATVTFRQLLMDPQEVTGWHYHPGVMISVIKRGTVTVEDGCGEADVFKAGQAFEAIGERVHRAVNGAEQLEEYNTFISPEGMPITVQVPERRCGPPRSRNECMRDWMTFTHPRSFSNQGDCIQYVQRGE